AYLSTSSLPISYLFQHIKMSSKIVSKTFDRIPKPKRRQSDIAFDAIRRAIVRCDLPPGTLVSESELEALFGFKRAAIRSALLQLASRGLVKAQHRKGYKIRPIS